MSSYVKAFRPGRAPKLWGLHNYVDVNSLSRWGTKTMLRVAPGQIWFTETGAIISRAKPKKTARNDRRLMIRMGAARSAAATARVFTLAAMSPRISRVYIYPWRAGTRSSWDSALLSARGTPRPSFDVFAREARAAATSDGTIYRGDVRSPTLTPFAAGGADGRTTATGMTLDGRGRLFVAGAGTGKAWVLSTRDGSTIKALDSQLGSSPTFVNDVALGRGYAYFTDSLRPVILRVSRSRGAIGELEPWLDLTGTPFAYEAGFNANGIVSLRGGRLLVVVQSNTGKLFRIDTRSREVSQIDLGGATLTNGDGLVLKGRRLYVLRNAQELIVEVKLRGDARSGSVGRTLTSDALMFPTTAALDRQGRLLVVNAQFDKRPTGNPILPFTVAALPLR